MIGEPPSYYPFVQSSTTVYPVVSSGTKSRVAGSSGISAALTANVSENKLAPTVFRAVTLNVYTTFGIKVRPDV